MVQGVFKRHPRDPTGRNPPRFALAGKYDSLPSIGEIDSTMSRAAFLLAKVIGLTLFSLLLLLFLGLQLKLMSGFSFYYNIFDGSRLIYCTLS